MNEVVGNSHAATVRKKGAERGFFRRSGVVLACSWRARLVLFDHMQVGFDAGIHLVRARLPAGGHKVYVEAITAPGVAICVVTLPLPVMTARGERLRLAGGASRGEMVTLDAVSP